MEMKENKQTESGSKTKIEDCVSENILENLYITSNKNNYDWLIVQKNKVFISNVFLSQKSTDLFMRNRQ